MPGCMPLTLEQIHLMYNSFKGRMKKRNRALFMFGISTGFRAGNEITGIRLKDVISQSGEFYNSVTVNSTRRKGGQNKNKKIKPVTMPISDSLKKSLRPWVKELNSWGFISPDNFLFCTRNGKRMSYHNVYHVIIKSLKDSGIIHNFPLYRKGTHSMRKTLSLMSWKDCLERVSRGEKIDPIKRLQQILGHNDPKTTLSYIPDDEHVFDTVMSVQNKLNMEEN